MKTIAQEIMDLKDLAKIWDAIETRMVELEQQGMVYGNRVVFEDGSTIQF